MLNMKIIDKLKGEYVYGDICMSELLRSHSDLPISVIETLLKWSGDDEYMMVTGGGNIISKDEDWREFIPAYSETHDITFVLEECYSQGKLISTEVVGFHYGRPDDEYTDANKGNLKAMYDSVIEW